MGTAFSRREAFARFQKTAAASPPQHHNAAPKTPFLVGLSHNKRTNLAYPPGPIPLVGVTVVSSRKSGIGYCRETHLVSAAARISV